MLRTHTCGELTKKERGQEVALCGWVHRHRNHGGIIFIDLRDRYGITQINFDPERNHRHGHRHSEAGGTGKSIWQKAYKLRGEWVIRVKGKVVGRPKDMVNKKLKTGEIEIEVRELEVLNKSKTPPFEIGEGKTLEANESLRLEYRFIDFV